jgi:hypothetical protein
MKDPRRPQYYKRGLALTLVNMSRNAQVIVVVILVSSVIFQERRMFDENKTVSLDRAYGAFAIPVKKYQSKGELFCGRSKVRPAES